MTSLKVEVYTKPDCSLCVPVLATAEKLKAEIGFELVKVDISKDPELMDKYGHEIPVVAINGRKAFKYKVSEAELRKKLRRAQPAAAPDLAPEERPPYVPAPPVTVGLLAVTLGASLYFTGLGLSQAQAGNRELAGALLDVKGRAEVPVPFQLESLSGGKVDLADYRDRVVFLNFWATWCPPCVEEMPSMLRMAERMKGDPRFVMLAVSADEDWEPVKKFFAGKEPPFPVLLDKGGEIAKRYGTTMFPETYVLVNHRIVGFIEGPRDWDKWFADAYLKAL